jgi:hypothetical protein
MESMLADHSQLNSCIRCDSNHTIRRRQIHRDWLLHEHVLSRRDAKFNHWKPVIRKRANVDIIHARMPAKLFNTPDILGSMRLSERHALGRRVGCAGSNLKANIAVSRSMFCRDRPCSDDADSQVFSLV